MAILSSSTSLMLRTIALWERKRSVLVPLIFLALVHWTLLYRTMFVVRAVFDDTLRTCVVVSTDPTLLKCTFFFTMGFDFGEFKLLARLMRDLISQSLRALRQSLSCRATAPGRISGGCFSQMWVLLVFASVDLNRLQGLVYFVVTFSTNSIPAVLNLLDLNAPMNVSIAACRAVMRLLDFNSDVYIHSLGCVIPTSDPRHSGISTPFILPGLTRSVLNRDRLEGGGVLVTRQQITMTEIRPPLATLNKHDIRRHNLETGNQESEETSESQDSTTIS
uniref:Uncharacterized protein n=1 Tax=Mycena chlorophos TaxID=658473 RepID=A0ABQ0LSF4_MYCCL|nr:predicted protein [Mycena chlorophos]